MTATSVAIALSGVNGVLRSAVEFQAQCQAAYKAVFRVEKAGEDSRARHGRCPQSRRLVAGEAMAG